MSLAISGTDNHIGVYESIDQLRNDGSIMRQIGVHRDDRIGTRFDRHLYSVPHGMAVAARPLAAQDLNTADGARGFRGAIGAGVIHD